jgi:carbamoyl-phosphate synthase large subunit
MNAPDDHASNNRTLRVLVTAVGGDLGQAIVKCLRLSARPCVVLGSDMQPGIGGLFTDQFHLLPPAFPSEPFWEALDRFCSLHRVDAVIPASEPELRSLTLLPTHPVLPSGARIVSQPPDILNRLGDKLACFESLKGKVPLAAFADASDRTQADQFVADHGFPVCIKERISSGQRGVVLAHDANTYRTALQRMSKPLLQGVIDGADREYSVGVFTHDGEVRLISYRRRLEGQSCSWYAELDQPQAVLDYCRAVALAVGTQGSINVQLRVSRDGPLLLEINPRFSSLAAARAACAFNDVEWSLLGALGLPMPSCNAPPPSFRYQRFLSEAVDCGNGWQAWPAWAPRSQ